MIKMYLDKIFYIVYNTIHTEKIYIYIYISYNIQHIVHNVQGKKNTYILQYVKISYNIHSDIYIYIYYILIYTKYNICYITK